MFFWVVYLLYTGLKSNVKFFNALFLADDLVCLEYLIMLSTSPLQSLHTAISSPRRHSLGSHGCCCKRVKAFLKPLLKQKYANFIKIIEIKFKNFLLTSYLTYYKLSAFFLGFEVEDSDVHIPCFAT